jgi:hypothetical protein
MKIFKSSGLLSLILSWRIVMSFCLGLLASSSLWAQLELVPLENAPLLSAQVFRAARIQALQLPFFDDFSTATRGPDPQLWQPGSGVYINNTLTINHPSVNIATFDGLNARGVPYNVLSEQAQGESDTLTSVPINLGGLTPADSVYLSFYWQAKGLGELPDGVDTFRLEFLNQKNDWITVWKKSGSDFDSLFNQSFIAITQPSFLHPNFQFRFRAFGRLSGTFDTWHLDYIYLNKKRSIRDRFIKDVAVRKPLTPLFRRYTAMPFRQYFANPAAETAEKVETDIVNLFNNFNFTSYTFTIFDDISGKVIQRYQEPASTLIAAQQTQPKSIKISPLTRPVTGTKMKLRYTFDLLTTDDQNPTIPSINLRRNDTLSGRAELSDYYAYDDGSAEFGVRMNQRLGRTAVRFVLTQPDTLGGVRMALVPFRKDLTGQGFTVQVWSNRDGKPDRVLYQKSVPVRYAQERNGFIDYKFDEGVVVKDTFYVGWLQISEDALAVGFDRNSTLGTSQLVTNLSQEWVNTIALKGSVMIRPYFGGKASGIITGSEPLPTSGIYYYPNPTHGLIRWDSESVKSIEVINQAGALLKRIIPYNGQKEASLEGLPEGIYYLKTTDGVREVTHKILKK